MARVSPMALLVGGGAVLGLGALALAIAAAPSTPASSDQLPKRPGSPAPPPRVPSPATPASDRLLSTMRTATPAAPAPARLLSTLRGEHMSIPEGMPERPGVWFTWREFIVTSSKVDNSLPSWAYPRILKLVRFVLDPVRARIGRPIGVGSGYRSPELNTLIGGAKDSQHMRAEAADIKAGDMPAERLATEIVRSGVPFDQVIWYDQELGGHVHVSHRFDGQQRPFSDKSKMYHCYIVNRDPVTGVAQKPYVKDYRVWAPPPEGVQS